MTYEPKVKCQELICGLAMLDPAAAGDAAGVGRLTFDLVRVPPSIHSSERYFRARDFISVQQPERSSPVMNVSPN